VLVVDQDPSDSERRVLASVKCNLAVAPASLCFSVVTDRSGAPRVEWGGQSSETADSLAAARATRDGPAEGTTKVEEAADLLDGWLGGGPMERSKVLGLGRQAGYSKATMERAANKKNIYRYSEGFGTEKRAYWSLRPFNGLNAPIDNNPETNGDPETNGNSERLTATPDPLFSHLSQPTVDGTNERMEPQPKPNRGPSNPTRRIIIRL
jgi:hypothetical protein